ncbi:helix-turn-helix domain-containing protein [Allomuricauda sp. ARW1Y1]|jgi:AraC-like DNA-binding protein|uniref:helix-turn-helix domain-containing protein n=1 Tax=Allomuricauda sp. ARW1Y1 TaxID=2663843 RepID=UPI0015C6C774|nr:helix-turn-helix transcriptional regulator [Muricauda sp. ARW1Y1]NYJ28210.1 AraC-like DNA-binding protein [Muricauda sp. ARW1Y1]
MKNSDDLITINDYAKFFKLSTLHPLVNVLDVSKGSWSMVNKVNSVRYHFYAVFLKQGQDCTLKYGRQNYDYQDGTLVFVGPGQVIDISGIDYNKPPSGHALLFHPDLIRGTSLGTMMGKYSFFSYELHEALHISQKERKLVLDCFDKIQYELSQNIDKHSKTVIISNIELFLNYCNRFYDRQFITRDSVNIGVVEQFESSLNAYILSGKAKNEGMPSVGQFAEEQHLSPNYFGDLVKKETGKSAMEFIRYKLIEIAKDKIFDPDKSISEIAFELGFKYPQHFTRLFKSRVGYSPSDYRMLN